MNRVIKILTVLGIIVGAGFIGYRYHSFSKKVSTDPLCAMAKGYQMHCVQLASPTIYDHGAYVHLDQTIGSVEQIAFPSDYVFSEHCSFAPASVAFTQFKEDANQYVNFGKHVFSIDQSLSAGVELKLPRIAGLSFKAGPKLSEIRSVTLEADSARYFNIDTRAFVNVLGSCNVRPACASVVKLPNVRVIKRLLVAKNLKYRVEKTSGESESLIAAVRSNNISVGMDATGKATSVDDLSSGKDMVFAVDFFDPTELQEAVMCREPLAILKVTGTTSVSASSGAKGYPGEKKDSADGKEVVASETAPDAPDRGSEGMTDPEARAWGLWNYDAATRTVSLYQRAFVHPGTRWNNDNELKTIPGSLKIWAIPKASIQNEVEVTLANELEQPKVLIASAKLDVNTSISLIGKLPLYSYFSSLTLISQDNTEHVVSPVWSRDDRVKEFELGRVKPGEVVKIRIGRKLESIAHTEDASGTIQEDISLTFVFR